MYVYPLCGLSGAPGGASLARTLLSNKKAASEGGSMVCGVTLPVLPLAGGARAVCYTPRSDYSITPRQNQAPNTNAARRRRVWKSTRDSDSVSSIYLLRGEWQGHADKR
jgi:hypothetical protein